MISQGMTLFYNDDKKNMVTYLKYKEGKNQLLVTINNETNYILFRNKDIIDNFI